MAADATIGACFVQLASIHNISKSSQSTPVSQNNNILYKKDESHPEGAQRPSSEIMQRLSATNPLRLVINNATRVASPSPAHPQPRPSSSSPLHQQQTRPATDGIGVLFIAFSIGVGLYACWVTQRTSFCSKIFIKALEPVSKFPDLNQPTYWMLGAGFLWMSFWILAVIGALNFYVPPLIIMALVLSLAWTAEVMRNVANLTVSRVIALYYLRGMQSSTQFCFQRALSHNLGSACLGSLFVPAIEALRIVARGLNLLEGEDEFMFSCAHCCLRVMESIFKCGNGWAYVQIAAYGKGFVQASKDTWDLFSKRELMVEVVDSDITSAICFLTGVCSGSICTIVVAAWTSTVHRGYIGTLSVLAAFIGYLMTRIAMALPHACVSCYYVCYAENPDNRLFDKTIPDRIDLIKSGRGRSRADP
ncbi:hypothetical protein DH2020_025730 [Rehmannia glutinosa]|uniref:Choline transporter-like protein n=1 Tax=Rehmannia glutinosa TaxID=99300 RepID=A0ABR0W1M6_REHGL